MGKCALMYLLLPSDRWEAGNGGLCLANATKSVHTIGAVGNFLCHHSQ